MHNYNVINWKKKPTTKKKKQQQKNKKKKQQKTKQIRILIVCTIKHLYKLMLLPNSHVSFL